MMPASPPARPVASAGATSERSPRAPFPPYVCLDCAVPLREAGAELRCDACQQSYHVRDGIAVFTAGNEYWCNVPRERMEEVLARAEAVGWRAACVELIPHCMPAIAPLYRADAQFLLPGLEGARVLDAGSMWGGLTFPIAQFAAEVHAVDKTRETLRLTALRAHQEGVGNIITTVSSLRRLPFPDAYFDGAILNGVLEWLGYDEPFVVDEHLSTRRGDALAYQRSPRDMQLDALRELRRVIRPDGVLYVAIENRIGLQYFLGHPDDHANVRFLPFLPRAWANALHRLIRGTEYRTYIYSPTQLEALLRQGGFGRTKVYSAHPHYGKIWRLVPMTIFDRVRSRATTAWGRRDVAAFSMAWKLTPSFMTKALSPSLAVVATGSAARSDAPRVLRILGEVGVLKGPAERFEAFMMNSRFEDHHPVVIGIFDREAGRPTMICKIARRRGDQSLEHESQALEALGRMLPEGGGDRIPTLLYYGQHEGITLQVSTMLPGRATGLGPWAGLRRIGRMVPWRGAVATPLLRTMRALGSRGWRARNRRVFAGAVDLLVWLQRRTQSGSTDTNDLAATVLPEWIRAIGDPQAAVLAEPVRARIAGLERAEIPRTFVHGDYDICNILDQGEGVGAVDLEHADFGGLPFFDLGNLLFSPLILEWRDLDPRAALVEYARRSGWERFIARRVEQYRQLTGLPADLLAELPTLAVLEQQVIVYPPHRDPADYPMRGAWREMLGWRLPLASAA